MCPGAGTKGAHQRLDRLPPQQGLVAGQEEAARKAGLQSEQRFQPQPDGVVPARQCVAQAGDPQRLAERFHLCRPRHDDAAGQLRGIGGVQCPAEQRPPAEIGQQLVGAETPGQPGRHDDTPDRARSFRHVDPSALTVPFLPWEHGGSAGRTGLIILVVL